MADSNQTSSKPEGYLQGPMDGGTTVDLGEFCAVNGQTYSAWLQFGGEVHSSAGGASKVDGVWIKHPPRPPSTDPVVVLMPFGGGPRPSYEAAAIVDLARCAAQLWVEDPSDEKGLVAFSAAVVARLGAAIESSIPISEGQFATRWLAASDDSLDLPF